MENLVGVRRKLIQLFESGQILRRKRVAACAEEVECLPVAEEDRLL